LCCAPPKLTRNPACPHSAAFNYSGGYFNPVLATSLKFGCRGHTAIEHIAVYWIGASLGAVASIYVYPLLRGKFSPAGALSSGSAGSSAAAAQHRTDKKSE
jgi:glycerol uptake facilitator-like aquaporin